MSDRMVAARGPYQRSKPTPPWLMDRIVYRVGPPPQRNERGCRIPLVLVLGGLLLLVICGVVFFWTGHGLDIFQSTPEANGEIDTPVPPKANATATLVPIVTAPTPLPTSVASTRVAPTPVKPAGSPTPVKYRVQSGDTLGGIAIKHGVTVQAIMTANNLTSNLVHVGDELVIPLPTPTPAK